LVTETDKACEQLIYTFLNRSYPSHKFIGEEGSSAQGFTDVLTDEPTWMCDPLDGTTNFVHRYPQCCVSLALAIKKQVHCLSQCLCLRAVLSVCYASTPHSCLHHSTIPQDDAEELQPQNIPQINFGVEKVV